MYDVIVLGGTGYLGRNIARFLNSKDLRVASTYFQAPLPDDFTQRRLDLTSDNPFTSLDDIQPRIIINCAGYVDHCTFQDNPNYFAEGIKSFTHIVQYCQSRKSFCRLINFGTADENSCSLVDPSPHPSSPYSLLRSTCSAMLSYLGKYENFYSTHLRLHLAYGSDQSPNRLIPYVINSCIANKDTYLSSGHQLRDFIYIDDICNLLYKIIMCPNYTADSFDLGCGIPYSVRHVAQLIQQKVKSGKLIFNSKALRPAESYANVADISALCETYNWRPSHDISHGLDLTLKCYQ